MTYREHVPHEELRSHVACYWTLFPSPAQVAQAHRVLPDGCMDLLFRVNGDRDVHASIIGTMTTAIVTGAATLRAYVGVRFRPGEAFAFLDVPATDATDLALSPLEAGLGDLSPLSEALGRARPSAWPSLLDRFLLARLSVARPHDMRLRNAVARIVDANGSTKVSAMAAEVGFSERQLERVFQERVGISPKAFARVSRVQALVSALKTQSSESLSWAALAAALGYADQAHLVREVRAIAGVTPGALARERGLKREGGRTSGSFNTDLADGATFSRTSKGELG